MFNLYSTPDLKATADEALPWVFDQLGFKQNYVYEFVRLALGYAGVAAAALTYYVEREKGFDAAYTMIVVAVIFYFSTSLLSFLLFRFVEHKSVYIGTKDGDVYYVQTASPSAGNLYEISVTCRGRTEKSSVAFNKIIDFSGRPAHAQLKPVVERALVHAPGGERKTR